MAAYHVFYSRYDLCKDQLGFQVTKLPPGGDSREQVSTTTILHHQIKLSAGFDHLVQTHDVGVAQLFHTADLRDSQRLAPLIQTQLVYDFDSDSL